MASAEYELQAAIVPLLKADATLSALIGTRVYDQPPATPTFPYVTIGDTQFLRDDATCISGGQIYLTLHGWSRAVGFQEVRRIADAVVEAVHMAPATLPSNRLVSLMHRQTRTFRDPDGLTSHAVIEFVASTHKPLT